MSSNPANDELGARKERIEEPAPAPLRHAYVFTLTCKEYRALAWIADRYTYAATLFDEADTELTGQDEMTLSLTEPQAWAFNEACDAEDGHMPCAGASLVAKLEALRARIV